MPKKLTKAEAQLWLSEAWGRSIRISHIRLRGDWLFVRDIDEFPDYADEVDCIHMPKSGDIWAEPYDCIHLEDSPFVPHNKEAVDIAIAKLDTKIAKYYAEYDEIFDEDEA
jgi:hypothetical protein